MPLHKNDFILQFYNNDIQNLFKVFASIDHITLKYKHLL